MKLLQQDVAGPMTLSYYHWNLKYIVKIELENYEQTFKIMETDIADLQSLRELVTKEFFLAKVFERFRAMDEDLAALLD